MAYIPIELELIIAADIWHGIVSGVEYLSSYGVD